jgi:hypothetical protein
MTRINLSTINRALVAMLVIGAMSGAAVAAERSVLGEYFTIPG